MAARNLDRFRPYYYVPQCPTFCGMSNTCQLDRPEWAKASTITKLLGPSRSSLYEAAAKGVIRTSSVKGRGKKRGSRFFSYDSVKAWIESSATGGEELPTGHEPTV